jgi:hypothetical protein
MIRIMPSHLPAVTILEKINQQSSIGSQLKNLESIQQDALKDGRTGLPKVNVNNLLSQIFPLIK